MTSSAKQLLHTLSAVAVLLASTVILVSSQASTVYQLESANNSHKRTLPTEFNTLSSGLRAPYDKPSLFERVLATPSTQPQADCSIVTINATLGSGATPDFPGEFSGQATGRAFPAIPTGDTTCIRPGACTVINATQLFLFDAYPFVNTSDTARCIIVTINASCSEGQRCITPLIYLDSYDPTNPCLNNIGRSLSGSCFNAPMILSFSVPARARFVVVISNTLPDAAAGCPYTLTVSGLPPQIICPANQTAVIQASCPPASSTAVNFAAPVDPTNCSGPAICNPPSGSSFPVGTTTVICTATDGLGQTATCSFTVTVFNGCLQDDSNPNNVVLFNTQTGEYRFCCEGTTFTGTGTVRAKGCAVTIQHNTTDRRLLITAHFGVMKGDAALQFPPGTVRCTITDRNMTNNSCNCQ